MFPRHPWRGKVHFKREPCIKYFLVFLRKKGGEALKSKKYVKIVILSLITVLICSILAIVFHALLPAKVDESRLDSNLIKSFGFPVVAVFYFIILYTQCAIVILVFKRDRLNLRKNSEIYFGFALSLIYMIGMQEIMLSASPFDEWNIKFVFYQALMGIGDSIPVIILCTIIGKIKKNEKQEAVSNTNFNIKSIILYTLILGSIRTVLSMTHLIENYFEIYPTGVIIWNYLFGLIVGISYIIIRYSYSDPKMVMIFGVSINWIIFNLFIGLIKHGAMIDSIFRSFIDAIVIVLLSLFIKRKLTFKEKDAVST